MSQVPGLDAKIQEVIEAAIEAELHESTSFYGSCAEGFTGPGRATEANGFPPEVTVVYPSGQAFVYGDIPAGEIEPLFDLKSVFARWEKDIKQAFERWDDLPEPGQFEGRLGILQSAAAGLAISGVTVTGSGTETEISVNGGDLETWVDDIQAEIGDYEGNAFEALNDSYLSRLDNVISGQHALAVVLGVAIASEQEIWRAAREDILDLAEEARKAFDAVASGGGASLNKTLSVFGAFVGAVGVFASGGTGLAVGALGASLGIITSLMPDQSEPAPLQMGGGSVSEVWTNLILSLSDANRAIGSEEQDAYLTCRQAIRAIEGHLDSFDFGTPGDFLAENRPGELYHPAENVALLRDGLTEIAAKVAVISSTLSSVRDHLGGATGSHPWERNAILGYGGHIGYYSTWEQLHETLSRLLARSSQALADLAERMILVSADFNRTDDQIDADLRNLISNLPDPTPREQVPFGHPGGG